MRSPPFGVVAGVILGLTVGLVLGLLVGHDVATEDQATPTTTTWIPTTTTQAPPPQLGFPTRDSVGVPDGLALPVISGNVVIDVDEETVDGLEIRGNLIVRAADVTVTNSRILGTGPHVVHCDGCQRLTITDSELIGVADGAVNCIAFGDYTVRRSLLAGCQDGAKANGGDATITDSWIGDLRRVGSSHNDGVQATRGSRITLTGNTIEKLTCQSCQTSALHITTLNGPISDVTITGNRLVSDSCFVVYLEDRDTGHGPVTNLTFTDNEIADTWSCSSGARGDWLRLDPGPGHVVERNEVVG